MRRNFHEANRASTPSVDRDTLYSHRHVVSEVRAKTGLQMGLNTEFRWGSQFDPENSSPLLTGP